MRSSLRALNISRKWSRTCELRGPGGKRLKGNRYFKARKFDEALKLYRESLAVRPYEKATLLNVAQVYLKKRAWDDALEFCNRAVRIGRRGGADFHAKALSRRATAYSSRKSKGDLQEAVNDLKKAMALLQESESKASQQSLSLIMEQFEQATQALRDEASESIVAEKLDKLPPPPPKKSKEEESAELLKQLQDLATKDDPLGEMLKGEGDGDSLRAVEDSIKEACSDDALPKLAE